MSRAAAVLCIVCSACVAEEELATEDFAVRVCADGPVVEGIDVSKWQTDIDWDAAAADGVKFAFIRTNHGLGDLDEKYFYNWSEARRVGILRGTYQYWLPAEDPIAQADVLLDRMQGFDEYDLPPVLDVEESQGVSAEQMVADIHLWMDHVEAAIGVKPIIYTAKYFWQDDVGMPDDFLDHPLWVANYNVDCPLMADPWPRWTFWQYTSSGSIAGIPGNVDRDHFNGTYDDLLQFIDYAHNGEPEPDPEPDPDPDPDPEPDPEPDPDPDPDPEGVPDSPSLVGCSTAPGGGGAAGSGLLLVLFAVVAVSRVCRGRPAGGSDR